MRASIAILDEYSARPVGWSLQMPSGRYGAVGEFLGVGEDRSSGCG